MSAIDQLKSASLVTQSLARQAILEAKTDPTKMQALQQAFEAKQEVQFEKPEQFDQIQQFVQDWACDKFELRPNTDNRLPQRATITEARITKVTDQTREVVTTPPAPPVNPGRYRDPLHITGVAESGATVEVYNASQPGRPVIASVTADATGKFRVELTDETKFDFGDQMGVVVKDSNGGKSRPVIVPTEPYLVTNTTTNFRPYSNGPISRTDHTSHMQAMQANHDVRDPFYQAGKVRTTSQEPRAVGEPWTMIIKGNDDAVEPNSSITVKIAGEVFTTKVADDGTFSLKVSGFTPGETLNLEVRDLNGRGIDKQIQVPHVRNEAPQIAAGMTVAPTLTAPTGMRETIGTEAPWVAIKASEVTVPFGAVVIKNNTTGEVSELHADDKGSISAAVGGISEFDVLQVATRDANGNFSESTTTMVVMPDKAYGNFLVPVDTLSGSKTPTLDKVLNAISGPPHDLFVKRGGSEVKDPRGPFLAMSDVKGLPPHGQLAVVRDGKVVQTLRADDKGVVKGYLRGVSAGDRLDFRVLDAAGRRFPQEIVGWEVPGNGSTKVKKENLHTPSDAQALKDIVGQVGSGTLDVEHAWVQAFSVGAQQNPPKVEEFKLHYAPLVFQGRAAQNLPEGTPTQLIEQLPAALAQRFGVNALINIAVTENNGTQQLRINDGRNQGVTVGVDYVVGNVNAGSFSSPLTQAHLPQITMGLKQSLALAAAAYDQGKEPGDLVYDRAISTAKTLLYVLDRFAVQNPTLVNEAKQAAIDGVPADFPFELFAADRVPPDTQTRPLAEVTSGKRTSTMSLIEARQLAMGRVESKPVSSAGINAPRVDVAAVLVGGQNNSVRTAVVRGRGNPGEVVQVFNVSAGKNQLVGEALVGPNGKYELLARGNLQHGDQLGIQSVSQDAKQRSRMSVVPTDAYTYDGSNYSSAKPSTQLVDQRPPHMHPASFTIENTSYDDKGAVREGGPFWRITSADMGVEPNATVNIRGRKPDGTEVRVSARADDQGRFSIEFPFPARHAVNVVVQDLNGVSAKVAMHTPALTEASSISGDRAAEAASGVVSIAIGDTVVKGVLVESSQAHGNSDVKISDDDRNDGFVDLVVRQNYDVQYANGNNPQALTFRIKVGEQEARKLAVNINDEITLEGAVLDAVNFDRGDGDVQRAFLSAQRSGTARIVDRDFLPQKP